MTLLTEATFFNIYPHILAEIDQQKEHLIPPNQYISFTTQKEEDELSITASVA